jgi:5-methylcytosine-specific restriction endonuclease McrA
MGDYSEQLLRPEWKLKRKAILKRDGYKCTVCGSKKNLHVHHTFYYDKFVPPWEYPNESLITVCEKCHLEYHDICDIEIKPFPEKKKVSAPKKKKRPSRKPRRKRKKRKIQTISLAEAQSMRNKRVKRKLPDGTICVYSTPT